MTVKFYGSVQEHAGDVNSLEVTGSENVRTLVNQLSERFGEHFKEFLLGDKTCLFLVNGSGIMTTGGLDTPLQANDTIEILPFVEAG